MNNEQPALVVVKPKNVRIWIVMTVLPFVLFILVAILAIIVQFTFNRVETSVNCSDSSLTNGVQSFDADSTISSGACAGYSSAPASSSPVKVGLNILQVLLGLTAVITMFLEPLWITMMILAIQHNNKLKTQVKPTS